MKEFSKIKGKLRKFDTYISELLIKIYKFILFLSKFDKDPVNRTVTMVVINTLLGFFLKATSIFQVIIDMISGIRFFKTYSQVDLSILDDFVLCSSNPICHSIETISDFFYIISMSFFLFFNMKFDKNFYTAFQETKKKFKKEN